ncbi:heavy metal translocating P-type ATPase [Clostridium lundense]|uniref:heavy metal translocating P-type ATPase n=1 Tax=Clostridium lundense TaxID=319475 RepID=UPI00048789DD|nr:heavy metal translocating P-type ATPase [Clostridium lundense]
MEGINKLELILEGLNCANCASKIERKVNELSEVNDASMNFINRTLTINLKEKKDIEKVLQETKNIVNKLEPHVKVVEKQKGLKKAYKVHSCNDHCECSGHEHTHQHEHGYEDGHNHGDIDSRRKIVTIIAGTIGLISAAFLKDNLQMQLSIYILSYILIGGDVILTAVRNIGKGEIFDENFLMVLATIGAFAIKEYPEAVSVMLFYQVGELFQDYAVDRSRKSISALMDIKPEFANAQRGNKIVKLSPEAVKVGDIIVVKPGERVPLDGKVIKGETFVDTSALTGESVQRKVKEGSEILSGFINKTSLITVKVSKNYGQSTIARILELVENAASRKAQTEKFITKFAKYYTPAVVITAAALAIIPPLVIEGAIFSNWLYRALIFLVISCPCALVISIPLGFFGGIGAASKKGILVKGGNYLEALNSVDTVVFDKTGTLTKGVFNVTEIVSMDGVDKEELVQMAALGESFSNHPIAVSICEYYGKDIDKSIIKNYEEVSGHGVKAMVKDRQLLLGNKKLMEKENIDYKEVDSYGTVVHIAVDNKYWGYIIISDEIKEDSKKAINELKKIGVKKVVMLTGDNKSVAEKVGKELEIDEVYSELLPIDKVNKFEKLYENKNGNILFVGDGINDAPVLSRADIGVAMGGLGSDAAIEASDVVIMTDEPSKIVTGINIAKKTRKIVVENIVFALGIKFLVLILGALGMANMWEAVFADVGVALIAVINSMRTLKN